MFSGEHAPDLTVRRVRTKCGASARTVRAPASVGPTSSRMMIAVSRWVDHVFGQLLGLSAPRVLLFLKAHRCIALQVEANSPRLASIDCRMQLLSRMAELGPLGVLQRASAYLVLTNCSLNGVPSTPKPARCIAEVPARNDDRLANVPYMEPPLT